MRKLSNLEYLQNKFDQVLENWYLSDQRENRIELFNVFNRLSIEIMKTHFKVSGEKCYNYAFHYSLDLLDKFLSEHTYQRGLTGREAVEAIKLSIQDYLREEYRDLDTNMFYDFEIYTNQSNPETEMLNYEIFSEINELLLLFFDNLDIKRYLPLAIDIISSGNHSKISNLNDQDFKYFCMLLISLGKKLGKYYTNNVSTHNHSINELTVLIAGLKDGIIPRELVFALDLSSLNKLVEFSGGATIKIPTRGELKQAYEDIKGSIRYPNLSARSEPLEENFETEKSKPVLDDTYKLFCTWLTENKKGLNQDKLDKILRILSQ